ncbi:MAG: cytochrome b/b6 domain-containing protein [Planctomycetes bacterium]|nr:cytochrome b/b6 domain-containing protein [Planctomycetota bacterium]
MADISPQSYPADATGHTMWVRICHWFVALSFLALTVTGYVILMCHPRLYWGEVGNDLTPALLELPISRNHQHGGWEANEPIGANRTFEIFNENSWARSLHFLAAWFMVAPGAVYMLTGVFTGHFRRVLWPQPGELTARNVWQEVIDHLRMRIRPATGGPQYGLLQKCGYCAIVFIVLPVTVLTGLAMSPAITAAYPILGSLFGGFQSARTIHFFAAVVLVLFLVIHVVMVVKSGFLRQISGMTFGRKP